MLLFRRLFLSPPRALSRAASSSTGARGDRYTIAPGVVEAFRRDGYVTLPGFLAEAELQPIEAVYDAFMRNESNIAKRMGKDFCDMSQGFDVKFEQFRIVNAMLPRVYWPSLQNSIYEKRAADVVRQLFPDVECGIDYDQMLK